MGPHLLTRVMKREQPLLGINLHTLAMALGGKGLFFPQPPVKLLFLSDEFLQIEVLKEQPELNYSARSLCLCGTLQTSWGESSCCRNHSRAPCWHWGTWSRGRVLKGIKPTQQKQIPDLRLICIPVAELRAGTDSNPPRHHLQQKS